MLVNIFLAALILAGLCAFPYVRIIWKMTRQVNQCERWELARPADFPSEISEFLSPYIQQLQELDYDITEYYQIYAGEVGSQPVWGVLFCDHNAQTYPMLGAIPIASGQFMLIAEFATFFETGQALFTTKAKSYGSFKPLPTTIKQHLENATIAELSSAHQTKIDDLQATPLRLETEIFLETNDRYDFATMELSAKSGRINWVEAGQTFRYSLGTSFKITWTVLKEIHGSKQTKAEFSEQAQSFQLDQEVQAFLTTQKPKPGLSKQTRGWLALGSLALFAAISATRFEPSILLIFTGALILHEGGHLLAMMLFGYRNPAVFFIPFFGALATAHKEHASLTEKFWISLAGPLPGLLLGIAIVIAHTFNQEPEIAMMTWWTSGVWRDASFILIGLNLFNLLPIYPLDGGHIADLLVLSRHPYLGFIYKSIGVLSLALLGMLNPLLLAFSLLIALSLPSSFRTARWFSQLRQELQDIPWHDDQASAHLVFSKLQSAPKLSDVQRHMIVTGIFEARRADTAPWWSRLGLSTIYLVSLIGGIVGGLYALMPNLQMAYSVPSMLASTVRSWVISPIGLEGHMRASIQRETEAIQRNPQDWDAYQRRAILKLNLEDTDGAIADAKTVITAYSGQTHPTAIAAYDLRSQAYKLAGEMVLAKADAKQAKQLRWMPRFTKAHAALTHNPKDAMAYLERGIAKYYLDNRASAWRDLTQASRLQPKNTQILISRAWLYEQEQNYDAALSELNQAIILEPDNVIAYESRSAVHYSMNQSEKGEADAIKVEEILQTHEDSQENAELAELRSQLMTQFQMNKLFSNVQS